MRFLDIAVAVMVGVSAIAGLVVWTPRFGDSVSNRMALQAHLRDVLVSFLESKGVPWILQASAAEVCTGLDSNLNGTVHVFVSLGTQTCGSPSTKGAVASNLTLALLPFEVNMAAWSGA